METIFDNEETQTALGKIIARRNGDVVTAPSDEVIDYYANTFAALRLFKAGVLFEDFLNAMTWQPDCSPQSNEPHHIPICNKDKAMAEFLGQLEIEEDHYAMQDELEQDDSVVCRNGTFVEPMHHHAHPRHAAKRA